MSALAGLAATLSVVGIFGVLAYSVAQRTNEIGIRMALGAAKVDVIRYVLIRGAMLLGAGVAIGFLVSMVAVRSLTDFLLEIESFDFVTLAAVAISLATAAMAASYLPARRAASVDPADALRRE